MRTPKRILERRRSVRVDESLPFTLVGGEGFEIEVRTLNISNSGALCLVDHNIALMTQLKVALTVPSVSASGSVKERILRLKGVVVRKEEDVVTEKFYIGVFFSDITPKDKKILQDYIDHRLKR